MNNKDKILNFIDIFIYLILAILLAYRGIKSNENLITKIMLYVLSIIFLIIAIFVYKQKLLYKEALHALNDELNIEKACGLYEKVLKYDFFKVYTRQRSFFDLMVMLELGEMEKVKWIVEMNNELFDSNADMQMIKYYYLMRADLALGNNDEVISSYNELSKLLNKGNLSPFFKKEQIEAIKAVAQKRYSDAYNLLKEIDLNELSLKDKKWVLTNLSNYGTGNNKKIYKQELEELLRK